MNFLVKQEPLPNGSVEFVVKEALTSWRDAKFRVRGVAVSKPEMQEAKIKFVQKDFTTYSVAVDFSSSDAGPSEPARYESIDGKEASTTVSDDTNSVRRRYSDFVWLRSCLARIFPGLFIPALPPKKLFGNTGSSFVEERCDGLQNFLARLVSRYQFMVHSKPFNLFITKHAEVFASEKAAFDKLLARISLSDTLDLYKTLFPDIQDSKEALPQDIDDAVHFMKTFLQDSNQRLLAKRNGEMTIVQRLTTIAKLGSRMGPALNENRDNLPDVVADVESRLSLQIERTELKAKVEAWATETEKQAQRWYYMLVKCTAREIQENESMLEVVNNFLKTAAQADKLKKQLSKAKKNQEEIKRKLDDAIELKEIFTRLLFFSEIKHFWTKKLSNVGEANSSFNESQATNAAHMVEVWGAGVAAEEASWDAKAASDVRGDNEAVADVAV